MYVDIVISNAFNSNKHYLFIFLFSFFPLYNETAPIDLGIEKRLSFTCEGPMGHPWPIMTYCQTLTNALHHAP